MGGATEDMLVKSLRAVGPQALGHQTGPVVGSPTPPHARTGPSAGGQLHKAETPETNAPC